MVRIKNGFLIGEDKRMKPSKDKTNRSALTIRFHGFASAETSTLKKNQNQYPPRHVMIAPICQITGSALGVFASGVA